jgi:hypothetical protein
MRSSNDEVEGVDVSRPIRAPKYAPVLVLVALLVLALVFGVLHPCPLSGY